MSIASSLNFDEYHNIYSGIIDDDICKLIKHGLLKKNRGNRILNIGSGPIKMATSFIEAFEPFSSEIILCEVNHEFCNDYRNSPWYKKNANSNKKSECSIKVINQNIIDYLNKIPPNSKFDLIWMDHVIYYFQLNYLETLITKLSNLLIPHDGFCMISIEGYHNTSVTKQLFEPLKPQWQLEKNVRKCLQNLANVTNINDKKAKNGKLEWFLVSTDVASIMTKQELFDLWKLFMVTNLYLHPDYHPSGKITSQDEMKINETIDRAFPLIAKPVTSSNNNNDDGSKKLYIWEDRTSWYFFKRVPYQYQSKL